MKCGSSIIGIPETLADNRNQSLTGYDIRSWTGWISRCDSNA